jgi:hypothetical protein
MTSADIVREFLTGDGPLKAKRDSALAALGALEERVEQLERLLRATLEHHAANCEPCRSTLGVEFPFPSSAALEDGQEGERP